MQSTCATCEGSRGHSGAILVRVPIDWACLRVVRADLGNHGLEENAFKGLQLAYGLEQRPQSAADYGVCVSTVGDSVG